MFTPNFSIKIMIIYLFIFGIVSLIYLNGINKILGLFLIYYSYINLLSLKNKGKKVFKLGLLKVNICMVAFIICLLAYRCIKTTHNTDYEILAIILFLFPLIVNYISIRNYKY